MSALEILTTNVKLLLFLYKMHQRKWVRIKQVLWLQAVESLSVSQKLLNVIKDINLSQSLRLRSEQYSARKQQGGGKKGCCKII